MFNSTLVAAAILLLLLGSGYQSASAVEPAIVEKRQFSDADVRHGKQSINAFCSRCHGRDGRGARGPDLTDADFIHAETDEDILEIISNGIPGTGMIGFGAGFDDYYWPVIAYIRSEQKKSVATARPPAGDIAKGRELFKKHQCASCHWLDGEGGRRGTDLTRLAATADYVRESMSNPNAQIDGTHQQVSLLANNGRVLTGRRLNENTYAILLMDDQENLHAVDKAELQISRPPLSLMPSFKGTLSKQDIEDITTYLFSLKKARFK